MSSQNQLSVCNLSLLAIGARAQVSSISPSDGSTAADACSQLYQFVFEALARTARWNCLRKQATLSLLTANAGTPENPLGTTLPVTTQQPWLYAYALPPDCLAMRFIVPTCPSQGNSTSLGPAFISAASFLPNGGQIPYAVAYSTDSSNNPIQIILTNQTQAQAVYTVNNSNPSLWDSQFTAAYVAALGVYLVPALAGNIPLGQMAMRTADQLISQARTSDGNESVVSQNREAEWIVARGGETRYFNGNGGLYGDYASMPWPAF